MGKKGDASWVTEGQAGESVGETNGEREKQQMGIVINSFIW